MKKFLLFSVLTFALVVFISQLSRVLASSNLLGYWKLDETSAGSTVVDSSGNGFDGTPQALASPTPTMPAPSTDVPSNITFTDPESLSFNGSQWVSIPDNPAFAMTSATFSVWVKFTSLSDDMDMIAKRSQDGSQIQWQFGYSGGGNDFKVSLANDGGHGCCTDYNWSPSPGLTTNTWYNIAVAIDGAAHTITWYQNGVSKHSESIGSDSLGTQVSSTDLTLGASYDGTGEFLHGLLDDVRIYNSALTTQDIADIAAGDPGPGVPSPTPSASPTSPPSPDNSASSSSPSVNSSACTNQTPVGIPNLFQIDAAGTYANLYFTTVKNTTGYRIAYGLNPNTNQYGDNWSYTGLEWILGRTIKDLSPNTMYYFKIQAANGCNGGAWSKVIPVKTKNKLADITQWFANLSPF